VQAPVKTLVEEEDEQMKSTRVLPIDVCEATHLK
jgi:hypothetical protein